MGNCINKPSQIIAAKMLAPMVEKNKHKIDLQHHYVGERVQLSRTYCIYCNGDKELVAFEKWFDKQSTKNMTASEKKKIQTSVPQTFPFQICYDKENDEKFIRSACEMHLFAVTGGMSPENFPIHHGFRW
mmetsp:Transcript_25788/g.28950  ORF Transcript_25788/g.28950 Transcript_25788/m.28950 type:complete len:130 (+) Transcript_25788:65-454(+)